MVIVVINNFDWVLKKINTSFFYITFLFICPASTSFLPQSLVLLFSPLLFLLFILLSLALSFSFLFYPPLFALFIFCPHNLGSPLFVFPCSPFNQSVHFLFLYSLLLLSSSVFSTLFCYLFLVSFSIYFLKFSIIFLFYFYNGTNLVLFWYNS